MAALYQPAVTRVMSAGNDPRIMRVLSTLLESDEALAVLSKLCLLDELRDCTVAELAAALKLLAPAIRRVRQAQLLGKLSTREVEVVRCITEGLSNKEISARLAVSEKTVKNHISHILAKMKLNARTQVAVHALRSGLV